MLSPNKTNLFHANLIRLTRDYILKMGQNRKSLGVQKAGSDEPIQSPWNPKGDVLVAELSDPKE
jgi:hypothetical protein